MLRISAKLQNISNWSINMLGVTDTSTSGTGGALKINVTGGSGPTQLFTLIRDYPDQLALDKALAKDATIDDSVKLLAGERKVLFGQMLMSALEAKPDELKARIYRMLQDAEDAKTKE